jgi:hypothetical protein
MKSIQLAINGSPMRGLELNKNMFETNAVFMRETTTEQRRLKCQRY